MDTKLGVTAAMIKVTISYLHVWTSRRHQVKNVKVTLIRKNSQTKRPNANGIELIASGGITPASVTTAVMLDGGVRSYNGLRISRFG